MTSSLCRALSATAPSCALYTRRSLTNGALNAKRLAACVNAFGRTSRHGHRRADATRHCLQQARLLGASERFCPWRRSCVSSSRKPKWHYRGRQNRIEWSLVFLQTSDHSAAQLLCPLYPRKRTWVAIPALCAGLSFRYRQACRRQRRLSATGR